MEYEHSHDVFYNFNIKFSGKVIVCNSFVLSTVSENARFKMKVVISKNSWDTSSSL